MIQLIVIKQLRYVFYSIAFDILSHNEYIESIWEKSLSFFLLLFYFLDISFIFEYNIFFFLIYFMS